VVGFFVVVRFASCELDVGVDCLPDVDGRFRDLLDEFRDKAGFWELRGFDDDDCWGGGSLAEVEMEELLDVDEAREGREAKDVEEAMEENDVDEAMERMEEAIVWSW
jgi:hypothetical protein